MDLEDSSVIQREGDRRRELTALMAFASELVVIHYRLEDPGQNPTERRASPQDRKAGSNIGRLILPEIRHTSDERMDVQVGTHLDTSDSAFMAV